MLKKVVVLGGWHLGSVNAACMAEAGNMIQVWDQSEAVGASWSKGQAPLFEPGLLELIQKNWSKNLSWQNSLQNSQLSDADWIVIAYDTPIDESDNILLETLEYGIAQITKQKLKKTCRFFVTSQVPVGTTRRWIKQIKQSNPDWIGTAYYMPENLRLGEAIKSFLSPDRIVLGIEAQTDETIERSENEFRSLTGLKEATVASMTLESAEMVKHALNSFLATCVVFANELSNICEAQGANAWDVVKSLKLDSRVGPKAFLRPGLGFAGGTLARDVRTLSKVRSIGESNFFKNIYNINTERNLWVVEKLTQKLGALKDKKICLLGITYKPGTSTVRRSPAIEIASLLSDHGVHVSATDPMADLEELSPQEKSQLKFEFSKDPYAALANADAAVLVTDWPEFKNLEFSRVGMRGELLIDTKNFLATSSAGSFHIVVPGKPNEVNSER